MSGLETRNIQRDSFFLMADVRIPGVETAQRVKVRNLSARGLMAEGPVSVLRGVQVSVELRNIGWVDGNVAWVQDDRFGIAFAHEVDPKLARMPVGAGETCAPRFTRPSSISPAFGETDASRLRKI